MMISENAGAGSMMGYSPAALGHIMLDCEGTGRNIKNLMDGFGYSPQDLADALSVSLRLVYMWINGESGVRPEHAIRMSRLYGVPLESIYSVKDESDE